MELIAGARNPSELQGILKLLNDFDLVEITVSDYVWATQQLTTYRLSHNVGILDCLVATPAYRLQIPLLTHNVKHFQPMLGSLVQQPY